MEFFEIYQKYGGLVTRRCRSILKDSALVDDAVQDVFMNLWRNYSSQVSENQPLSALLFQMATRVSLNSLRNNRRFKKVSHSEFQEHGQDSSKIDEIVDQTTTAADHIEAVQFLVRLFQGDSSSFRASTQEIAIYYYHDQMTYEEISRRFGLSVSGIRKRLRHLGSKARMLEQEQA